MVSLLVDLFGSAGGRSFTSLLSVVLVRAGSIGADPAEERMAVSYGGGGATPDPILRPGPGLGPGPGPGPGPVLLSFSFCFCFSFSFSAESLLGGSGGSVDSPHAGARRGFPALEEPRESEADDRLVPPVEVVETDAVEALESLSLRDGGAGRFRGGSAGGASFWLPF